MNDTDFSALKYNPDTGVFIWNTSPSRSVKAGHVAGTPNSNGHIQICVNGKRVFAHRLAWFITYGVWPSGMIDHINRIRGDNQISNLRDVGASENAHNQVYPQRHNTSGYLGVTFSKNRNLWQAGICISRKFKFLGYFVTPELAHAAYLKAKRIHHPTAPVR